MKRPPQSMWGYVQSIAAQLRIAGGGEGSSDRQHRRYARDEEKAR